MVSVQRRGPGIKAKLVGLLLVLAFVPLTALGIVIYESGKAGILRASEQSMLDYVQVAEKEIEYFTSHNLEDLTRLASLSYTRDLAERIVKGAGGKEERAELRLALFQSINRDVELMFFLHPETGEVLSSSDPAQEGKFFDKRPYFKDGRNYPIIYSVHYSLPIEKNIFALSAPVRKGPELLGVLVSWVNLDRLKAVVSTETAADIHLVSRSNLHIFKSRRSDDSLPIRAGVYTEAAQSALAGETGSGIYTDASGRKVVGAYTYLNSLGLALISEAPMTLILTDINRLRKNLVMILFGLAVLVLASSVLIGNRVAARVGEMTKSAGLIASGNFNQRIEPVSGDELGLLSNSMNLMAESLSQRERSLKREIEVNSTLADLSRAILVVPSVQEVSALVLEAAKRLTGSSFGYAGYIDPETGHLVVPAMTRDTWDEFRVKDKNIVFEKFGGLWGWVLKHKKPLMTNSPGNDPRSEDIPGGHVSIERFLSVPALVKGTLVGQLALANPQRDYEQEDLDLAERLAALYAMYIQHGRDEAAMKEHQESFKALYDSSLIAVVTLDREGRFLKANQTFSRMFQIDDDELGDFDLDRITHPEELDETQRLFAEMTEGKRNYFRHVKRCLRKDGSTLWGDVDVFSIRGPEGPLRRSFAIVVDISERKRMEDEVARVEKLESVNLMAGGIAHDFNNLLATILGNVSIIRLNTDPEDPNFERVTEAEKAVLRARDLTQQLLAISRDDAPLRETSSVRDIIRKSCDFSLRGSNVGRRFIIGEGLWHADVDPAQIEQVLNNIIINAAQAMPGGGMLSVRAENFTKSGQSGAGRPAEQAERPAEQAEHPAEPAEHPAEPAGLNPGNYVKVSVSDTGAGIPAEHLTKIFYPYFTTRHRGSGLGLAGAYSIMKKHGGLIEAESELGDGATFHIYLPASTDSRAEPVNGPARGKLELGTGRVLVMDDEGGMRVALKNMIEALGYEAVLSADGEEMLKCYGDAQRAGEDFDAVIIDLTVKGGMGGRDAVKVLKGMDPGARAIVTSGYSADPVVSRFRDSGFDGVLVKPFDMETLGRELKRLIKGDRHKTA